MSLSLNWVKCQNDNWCPFTTVELGNVTAKGVYVIWKPGNPGRVIRVGQGDIAARLKTHRSDSEISKHGHDLLVTWASVAAQYRDGVERFLAERYSPVVGEAFPNVAQIVVNLPGA